MTMRLAAVLTRVDRGRGGPERTLLLVPSLAGGTLASADLGVCSPLHSVAAEIRLADGALVSSALERLAFWFAREGGWVRRLDAMTDAEVDQFRAAFGRCDVSLRDASPEGWSEAVRRVLGTPGVIDAAASPTRPLLTFHADGPACSGFAYDRQRRILWVSSPLAPPSGDVVELAVELADGPPGGIRAVATVAEARGVADATPGSPAGFGLALPSGDETVHGALAARCPPASPSRSERIGPRYRVMGEVRISEPVPRDEPLQHGTLEGGYLENLSHGGAFIRTARRWRVGERLHVHLHPPGGGEVSIPSTVVHRSKSGVGVRFSTAHGDELLAAALAALPGRPRRVLVVDDDALTRSILGDAFEARGFEVIRAPDGEAGLRAITDELLSLDAVVTDVQMPGLSGDELVTAVRRAGGETDLVLVVMSATLEHERMAALIAAGADAVLLKARGRDAVVDAVEAALAHRAQASLRPSLACQRASSGAPAVAKAG